MDYILQNGCVYIGGLFVRKNLAIIQGKVFLSDEAFPSGTQIIDCKNKYIFPGFTDVHTHLREPGFSYKETVFTGTRAAASAGYRAIFAMPNLDPVPDCEENILAERTIIERDAAVKVYPYAAITRREEGKELSDMDRLAPYAIAFSDDGRGVADGALMEEAMKRAKRLNKIIAAHCEDLSLVAGGKVHDGKFARLHGIKGIPSSSEYLPIERDLRLAERTGADYHVCHVSAKESVGLIRKAKRRGIRVTAETAPHYLLLDDEMIEDDGKYKMNPPVRAKEDRLALIEGILDGTIDMIATDHAPHSEEEKSKGIAESLNGIVGLETAFPVLYTGLVKTGIITLEKLVYLMSVAPAKRFGLEAGIADGKDADLAVFDLEEEYEIDPAKFISKGKSTPFAGRKVFGRCVMNFVGGKLIYAKQ